MNPSLNDGKPDEYFVCITECDINDQVCVTTV